MRMAAQSVSRSFVQGIVSGSHGTAIDSWILNCGNPLSAAHGMAANRSSAECFRNPTRRRTRGSNCRIFSILSPSGDRILMRCAPLAILAVAFLFGTCARAQTQKSSAAPTLKVYTRETVVDVSVTDAKGNPVHGLTHDDFTVKEDGKPQPIRSFEEFGASATPQPTRKLPPNVYTNLQPPPAGPALNIILLDGLNMAPPDASAPQQVSQSFTVQARVKEGAEKYLRAMPPGTRVAVLNLTDHLRILQGFTSDPALLRASVDAMQLDMEGHASTVTKGMPPLQIEQLIEQWRTLQNSRNRATLEALNQIAVDFAGVKGKKNLFWFSAGFPTLVLQGDNEQAGLPDYNVDLHRTYALL